MKEMLLNKTPLAMAAEQNMRIQETVQQERKRLLNFIKKRVSNVADAEDILQDVLYQFTEYSRVDRHIDSITAWLFTVTRNKITDFFRKKRETTFSDHTRESDGEETLFLAEIISDPTAQSDAPMTRKIMAEAITEAIAELPEDQRTVFIQHEIDGISFNEMSAQTGVSVNTLLSRKRYAVLYLRKRLAELYEELLKD
jgi:RNA polymerase sigma factor (sigma-70 family)